MFSWAEIAGLLPAFSDVFGMFLREKSAVEACVSPAISDSGISAEHEGKREQQMSSASLNTALLLLDVFKKSIGVLLIVVILFVFVLCVILI